MLLQTGQCFVRASIYLILLDALLYESCGYSCCKVSVILYGRVNDGVVSISIFHQRTTCTYVFCCHCPRQHISTLPQQLQRVGTIIAVVLCRKAVVWKGMLSLYESYFFWKYALMRVKWLLCPTCLHSHQHLAMSRSLTLASLYVPSSQKYTHTLRSWIVKWNNNINIVVQILLEFQNRIIADALSSRIRTASNGGDVAKVSMTIADFDGVMYNVQNPDEENPNVITVSLKHSSFHQFEDHGGNRT